MREDCNCVFVDCALFSDCIDAVSVEDRLQKRVFVVVSMRDLSISPQSLPAGTLVLSPAASLQMYGPTLSSLATWFDIEHRIAIQAAEESAKKLSSVQL